MKSSLKVVTILGTRPEIIRLSRVMALLDRYLEHRIVHTGQNYDYELNEVFFKDLGIRRPDLEEVVGPPDAEVLEEHLVELVVVVLSCVNDPVFEVPVQQGHDPAQTYYLGPCAEYRGYLEAALHGEASRVNGYSYDLGS